MLRERDPGKGHGVVGSPGPSIWSQPYELYYIISYRTIVYYIVVCDVYMYMQFMFKHSDELMHKSQPAVSLQAIDFPRWLQSSVHPDDRVVVYMDLGTGREFEMLQALLISQSLTLIDHLIVQWHYQAEVSMEHGTQLQSAFVMCITVIVATM